MTQDDLLALSQPGDTPPSLDGDFVPDWQALLPDGATGGLAPGGFDAALAAQAVWDLLQPLDRGALPPGSAVTYFAPLPCDEHGAPLTMAQLMSNLDAVGWAPSIATRVACVVTAPGSSIY